MKKIIILVVALWFSFSSLTAIPKYTDLQNARNLAGSLMHATIGEDFLVAIDIKKAGNDRYYLEGISQTGKIYRLFISYLQQITRSEKIFLRDNRVLIFPYLESSSFVILDRKEFRKVALNAKSYLKYYKGDDPLAGQSILHAIKAINIVPYTVKSHLGKNQQGNTYHYSIELHNGEKDLVTYYDAYKLLEEQRLLADTYPKVPVIDKVYSIADMKFSRLNLNQGGTPQFSILLTLAEDNLLTEEMIGIEILEQKKFKNYLLYITIPNTVVNSKFAIEPEFEYLKNIELVNDARYVTRTLLKMRFNPLLTNIAPHISKIGKRNLYITFFYRSGYNAIAQREEKSLVFNPFFEQDQSQQAAFAAIIDKHRATFTQIRTQQDINTFASEMEKLVENINQDGVNVTSDKHLSLLFELRKQIRELGFTRIINTVQESLNEEGSSLGGRAARKLLVTAEEFTGDRKKIEQLRQLQRKINN